MDGEMTVEYPRDFAPGTQCSHIDWHSKFFVFS